MSEFEKRLFWWTEINNFALELKKDFKSVPWLSLKYEDVFGAHRARTLSALLSFLSLPEREPFLDSTSKTQDMFSSKTHATLDLQAIEKYPQALAVMAALGYKDHDPGASEIRRRYQKSLLERGIWRLESSIRLLAARVNGLTRK